MQYSQWTPPVRFYLAGHQTVNSRLYRCDCRCTGLSPKRLLIKRSISGCGVLYSGNKRYELSPGWMFIVNRPGDYVYCYEGEGEPWEFEYVSLIMPENGNWLPGIFHDEPAWDAGTNSEIGRQMQKLVRKITSQSTDNSSITGYTCALESVAIQDSAEAYHLYLSCIASRLSSCGNYSITQKLREHLRQNFNHEIHLSSICTELGYTPEALSRIFRHNYGLPPLQYLINLRISRARQLLQQPNLSLKQIAAECGFSSANYLCRIFRQHLGVTPGEYRKNPDPLTGAVQY